MQMYLKIQKELGCELRIQKSSVLPRIGTSNLSDAGVGCTLYVRKFRT